MSIPGHHCFVWCNNELFATLEAPLVSFQVHHFPVALTVCALSNTHLLELLNSSRIISKSTLPSKRPSSSREPSWEGGKEGRRREGGKERGKEGRREGGKEEGKEGGREGGKEGREGRREGGKEGRR